MQTEDDFLRAALAAPQDDNLRLVYADWLDEQDDQAAPAKSEFLRLLAQPPGKPGDPREKRLKQLAASLDTDWSAAVSKLAVESCQKKSDPGAPRMRFAFSFVCDRRWEDMAPTDDRTVRHCAACGENVHFCDTITDARTHAFAGHCVAVDLGIIRRERDLDPPLTMMVAGRPSADSMRRFEEEQQERLKPDPVSADRERRKKAAANES